MKYKLRSKREDNQNIKDKMEAIKLRSGRPFDYIEISQVAETFRIKFKFDEVQFYYEPYTKEEYETGPKCEIVTVTINEVEGMKTDMNVYVFKEMPIHRRARNLGALEVNVTFTRGNWGKYKWEGTIQLPSSDISVYVPQLIKPSPEEEPRKYWKINIFKSHKRALHDEFRRGLVGSKYYNIKFPGSLARNVYENLPFTTTDYLDLCLPEPVPGWEETCNNKNMWKEMNLVEVINGVLGKYDESIVFEKLLEVIYFGIEHRGRNRYFPLNGPLFIDAILSIPQFVLDRKMIELAIQSDFIHFYNRLAIQMENKPMILQFRNKIINENKMDELIQGLIDRFQYNMMAYLLVIPLEGPFIQVPGPEGGFRMIRDLLDGGFIALESFSSDQIKKLLVMPYDPFATHIRLGWDVNALRGATGMVLFDQIVLNFRGDHLNYANLKRSITRWEWIIKGPLFRKFEMIITYELIKTLVEDTSIRVEDLRWVWMIFLYACHNGGNRLHALKARIKDVYGDILKRIQQSGVPKSSQMYRAGYFLKVWDKFTGPIEELDAHIVAIYKDIVGNDAEALALIGHAPPPFITVLSIHMRYNNDLSKPNEFEVNIRYQDSDASNNLNNASLITSATINGEHEVVSTTYTKSWAGFPYGNNDLYYETLLLKWACPSIISGNIINPVLTIVLKVLHQPPKTLQIVLANTTVAYYYNESQKIF